MVSAPSKRRDNFPLSRGFRAQVQQEQIGAINKYKRKVLRNRPNLFIWRISASDLWAYFRINVVSYPRVS